MLKNHSNLIVYGKPEKHIDMGETTLTPQILDDYMRDLKSVWTPNRYHIMDNNCNNFSNEVCYFLTNRNIPEYITDLPNNFMQSPLGMMLRPMIDSFFSSNSNTNSSFGDSEDQVVSSSSLNPEVKAERDFPVVELKTIGDIDSFVEKGSGILVIIKDASDSALLNSFRLLFRYKKSLPIGSFSKNIDRQQQLNFAKVHFNLYKQYSKSITEVYTNSIATFINGSIVNFFQRITYE